MVKPFGDALAKALGKGSIILMRGHGAAITATSLHLVVGKSYYLNLNARLQMQAIQLGGLVTAGSVVKHPDGRVELKHEAFEEISRSPLFNRDLAPVHRFETLAVLIKR